ncbi:MAG: 6-carboxytetrahydropterin synthase QueD [Candidatus Omnitrophica bacterium]|nr:6-carboxytetrahydropterin synthase QueD [Candidatus Omnitrophota bacterium]
MYEIKVTDEFSGAHRLRNYKGKCESLHGHNWRVKINIYSSILNVHGMVMDFKELKKHLKKVLAPLDHAYLNGLACFKKKNPTSENIAKFVHEKLSRTIKKKMKVSVRETGTSEACFYD